MAAAAARAHASHARTMRREAVRLKRNGMRWHDDAIITKKMDFL